MTVSSRKGVISHWVTKHRDNLRCRIAFSVAKDSKLPSPLRQVPGSDDLLGLVVPALDENMGLGLQDQPAWRVFLEYHNRIHASEGGKDRRSAILGDEWTSGSLEAANALVGIEADQEPVSKASSLDQVPDVARMDQIETTVREYESKSCTVGLLQKP